MNYEAINFGKKFALFDEKWQPKVIAEMNDYQFKIVKLQGDFIWHNHKNTDETFIVLRGYSEDRFSGWLRSHFCLRDVCCPEGC
jgi:mannose-6-phosphate isomerase-like protein (cupin superfamily)